MARWDAMGIFARKWIAIPNAYIRDAQRTKSKISALGSYSEIIQSLSIDEQRVFVVFWSSLINKLAIQRKMSNFSPMQDTMQVPIWELGTIYDPHRKKIIDLPTSQAAWHTGHHAETVYNKPYIHRV